MMRQFAEDSGYLRRSRDCFRRADRVLVSLASIPVRHVDFGRRSDAAASDQLNFVAQCRIGRLTRSSADQRGLEYAEGLQTPFAHLRQPASPEWRVAWRPATVLAHIQIDVFAESDTAESKGVDWFHLSEPNRVLAVALPEL